LLLLYLPFNYLKADSFQVSLVGLLMVHVSIVSDLSDHDSEVDD